MFWVFLFFFIYVPWCNLLLLVMFWHFLLINKNKKQPPPHTHKTRYIIIYNLIIGWEYACGVRYLPPCDYLINQWTGTFIYNMKQLLLYKVYLKYILDMVAELPMTFFRNRQNVLSSLLAPHWFALTHTKSPPKHSTNPTNDWKH